MSDPTTGVLERLFAELDRDPRADPVALAARLGIPMEEVLACRNAMSALASREGPWRPGPGDRVGGSDGLEIRGLIARGGMGVVYRAWDPRVEREVAVKFLLLALSPVRRERFLREGRIAAALDHPGIVKVHALGEEDGRPFIVQELVEGCRTLLEAAEGLALSARAALVRDAARALGAAHARGVVHRDVKPANILVDGAGRVRVADFGVAIARSEERLTATGQVVGTPLYMAPEQITGTSAEGPEIDTWALGVVLYEALGGDRPFAGTNLAELIAAVTNGRPRPLRELVPAVPSRLEAVCLRALDVDPRRRWPDGEAMARALDEALAAAPAPRRWGGLVAVGTGLLFGVGGALLLRTWTAREPAVGPESAALASSAAQSLPPVERAVESILAAGRVEEAERAATEAIAAGSPEPRLRRLQALARLARGDLDGARSELQRDRAGVLALDLVEARLRLEARTRELRGDLAGHLIDERRRAEMWDLCERVLALAEQTGEQLGPAAQPLRVAAQVALIETFEPFLLGDLREEGEWFHRMLERIGALDRGPAARRLDVGRAHQAWKCGWLLQPRFRALAVLDDADGWSGAPAEQRFVAHAIAFLVAEPGADAVAKLGLAERALELPRPEGAFGELLRRDVISSLARTRRHLAHAARVAGEREACRRLAEESLRLVALAAPHDPREFDRAQGVLAHLLLGDLPAARAAAEKTRRIHGARQLLLAECDLVEGKLAEALFRLNQLVTVEEVSPEVWLARAHARALSGDAEGSRADLAEARSRRDPTAWRRELGIDWHQWERIDAVLAGGWWPGAE